MGELAAASPFPFVGLRTAAERRMRFGPFPSTAEAVRFAGYSAAGAVVIPWWGVLAWLPVLGCAFLVTVWQTGAVSVDRWLWHRVAAWERAWRSWEGRMSPRVAPVRGSFARIDPGGTVTVLKCQGRPTAFLPPQELEQKFRRYRELLRSLELGIVLVGVGVPVDGRRWLPLEVPTDRADAPARAAYGELVNSLCRHRYRRRIYLLQWSQEADTSRAQKLEERTRAVLGHLEGLGVAPERLEGSALGAALSRFGWCEAPTEEARS